MGEIVNSILCVTSAAAACLILANSENLNNKKNQINQKKRKTWIKEWRKSRKANGNYQYFIKELNAANPDDFKNFLRMDETCFDHILSTITKHIEKKNTKFRDAIPPQERLAVTLRFLATGEDFKDLDYNTKLSASFLRKTVLEVCEAIYENMKREFLKFPSTIEEWMDIAKDFEARWQFPLCLGALDGKHIAFTPSKANSPLFYNYKGFTSIVLLGMADANARFIYVDIGCNGRISDGGVLSRSDLMHIIKNGDKYFPPKEIIGNGRLLPYVIVADDAFPLQEHIMKPFSYKKLENWKIIYNQRLSRARQNIERAFGILSNRFQILQKTIKLREDKTTTIAKACCVLHNYLIKNSDWYLQNMDNPQEQQNMNVKLRATVNTCSQTARNIRKMFAEYFSNEGILNL